MGAAALVDMPGPSCHYRFVDHRLAPPGTSPQGLPPIIREIVSGLAVPRKLPGRSPARFRSLPLVLLYDDVGLDLFDRLTYLPEYYLTNCEIDILQSHSNDIVAEIPDGSDVIELGCGSLRKTEILLDALNRQRSGVTYYAIDVMPGPLHASMSKLSSRFTNVSFVALCGTYDQVLPRLRESSRRKTVLWLGSSIGNYHADEAIGFLRQLSSSMMSPGDAVIIGMDRQKDRQVILDAYHDSQGLTTEFELNILVHINAIIGEYVQRQRRVCSAPSDDTAAAVFDKDKFTYVSTYDEGIGRHDIFLEAREDVRVCWPREVATQIADGRGTSSECDVVIKCGERIYIESAYKYSDSAAEVLAQRAGLGLSTTWTDSRGYFMLSLFCKPRASMVARPTTSFTSLTSLDKWSAPTQCANRLLEQPPPSAARGQPSTIPSIDEWRHLWAVWDMLTCHVVPWDQLGARPIGLRHPLIFYLGHIPAFADIHMAAAESSPLTAPAVFAQWFERGIDPNMEDPTKCHDHSAVPDKWPAVSEIVAYRSRVCARISAWVDGYEQCGRTVSYDAARHIWMAFEHEAEHIETFLYMVLQMSPTNIRPPIAASIARKARQLPRESWISYAGSSKVVLGMQHDNESALGGKPLPDGHTFGWDNESPSTTVAVGPFRLRTQPVTNGEYLIFLERLGRSPDAASRLPLLVPQSWVPLISGSERQAPADADAAAGTGALASDYGVRTLVGTPSIADTEAALWPVTVSLAQAEAYAEWHGKRLPAEAEWTHAARTYHLARALTIYAGGPSFSDTTRVDDHLDDLLAGRDAAVSEHPYDPFIPDDANVGLAHWHPQPVTDTQAAPGQPGQMPAATFVGSAWEWTTTPFHPYPGFCASPMYPGYSSDFFDPPEARGRDSTHHVLKGGSYATHPRLARRQTFRNWYQRGYPFVLATFRLCEDAE
ncbi:hypothetical protein LPJ61_001617 [Coemansia biformis]|uniref:Uncharacterized protein n=1 Tax=Coemansia biformis TaxID=1286918 RepID=A0A9W8CXX8_9FUNG|nr:hypothetical protein LPJ61_001617 [Coemansia biformis]